MCSSFMRNSILSDNENESRLVVNPQMSLFPAEAEDDIEEEDLEPISTSSDRPLKSRRTIPQEIPNRFV